MPSRKLDLFLKAAIGLMVVALIYVASGTLEQRIVNVGETAPSFSITADNGKTITRSEFGGRLLVLNFWATWCPPCIQEMPSLDAFQEKMRAKGVIVVGVSVDKNDKTYQQFLNRAKVSFVTARDPEANISSSYGTFKYPETYIINADGKVVEKFVGPENWMDDAIIKRIEKLL